MPIKFNLLNQINQESIIINPQYTPTQQNNQAMYPPQQKPYITLQRSKDYTKHVRRLNQILKEHRMKECHWGQTMHLPRPNKQSVERMRYRRISEENERLASSIIKIARRKSLENTMHKLPNRPNKRVEDQRKIDFQNHQLMERLVTKQSEFSRAKMMKGIEEYERIKRLMQHNKRPHHSHSADTTANLSSIPHQ